MKPILSHCLAHGPEVTPDSIAAQLEHGARHKYQGLTIVAALIPQGTEAKAIARPFTSHQVKGLVCGFIPGKNPDGVDTADPLKDAERDEAKERLRPQFELVADLAAADAVPPYLVGPAHTWHRQPRQWTSALDDGFNKWMDVLDELADEYGIQVALEVLNEVEDGTDNPTNRVVNVARERDRFWLHYDLGHWYSRGHTPAQFPAIMDLVRFLEWTNKLRLPLEDNTGLQVAGYVPFVDRLHEDCVMGCEPFDPTVCSAFDLPESIAKPRLSGPDTLVQDAAWFARNGLMPQG